MFLAARQDLSRPEHENISQLGPILVVAIDHQRNSRVLADILQPFKFLRRGSLRFLVDGRKKIYAVENETNGDYVRLAGFIRSRKVADAGGAKESQSFFCQRHVELEYWSNGVVEYWSPENPSLQYSITPAQYPLEFKLSQGAGRENFFHFHRLFQEALLAHVAE